jgi:flavin reductase (DIM6/NTAB) family NADH-FMN oxidoreductase RutF
MMLRQEFVVADLDDRAVNRLTTGAIGPRPIAWVGTMGIDGVANVAPFSFFNAVSSRPPMVMFSSSLRAGVPKDSLRNVRETRVFTLSAAIDRLAIAVNATSAAVPPDVDEFALAGITAEFSTTCIAPAVAESPVVIECEAEREVDLSGDNNHDGYVMTIGRVTRFRVAHYLIDDTGRIDQAAFGLIARMGGPTYARTTDLFEIARPDPLS